MSLKSTAFQGRIKKIMQSDRDVGKVAAASTFLVSCTLDQFLSTLVDSAADVASARNARTISAAHLKSAIFSDPLLDFCKEVAASAPDLPPADEYDPSETPAAAPKRSRKAATGTATEPAAKAPRGGRGGSRQGGRGRGRTDADAAVGVVETALGDVAAGLGGSDALEAAAAALPMNFGAPGHFLAVAPGQAAEEEDYDE